MKNSNFFPINVSTKSKCVTNFKESLTISIFFSSVLVSFGF